MPETSDVIAEKLDSLVRLTAFALVDGKKQIEQIRILSLAGLKPAYIAEILSTTRNTVNVVLSGLRRKGSVPSGGRKKNVKD